MGSALEASCHCASEGSGNGLGTAFFENMNTQAIISEDNDEEIELDEFNENERTNGIVNGPFANMEVQEL